MVCHLVVVVACMASCNASSVLVAAAISAKDTDFGILSVIIIFTNSSAIDSSLLDVPDVVTGWRDI